MGGTSSVVVGDTKIDLNNYTCSDRGLILPCNNITSKKIKIKINLFFFIQSSNIRIYMAYLDTYNNLPFAIIVSFFGNR